MSWGGRWVIAAAVEGLARVEGVPRIEGLATAGGLAAEKLARVEGLTAELAGAEWVVRAEVMPTAEGASFARARVKIRMGERGKV